MNHQDTLARIETLEKRVAEHETLIAEIAAKQPSYSPRVLQAAEWIVKEFDQQAAESEAWIEANLGPGFGKASS